MESINVTIAKNISEEMIKRISRMENDSTEIDKGFEMLSTMYNNEKAYGDPEVAEELLAHLNLVESFFDETLG